MCRKLNSLFLKGKIERSHLIKRKIFQQPLVQTNRDIIEIYKCKYINVKSFKAVYFSFHNSKANKKNWNIIIEVRSLIVLDEFYPVMLVIETKPRSNSPINTKYLKNDNIRTVKIQKTYKDEIEYSNRTSVGSSHTDQN